MAKRPPPPGDLGQPGAQLWRDIAWKYELAPHESRILRDACKAADVEALLEGDIATSELKTTGSMGQEILNDSLKEWRQYSNLVVGHLLKLKLEHTDAAVKGAKSRQASARTAHSRQAARGRWSETATK